jgi:hypothetical protein
MIKKLAAMLVILICGVTVAQAATNVVDSTGRVVGTYFFNDQVNGADASVLHNVNGTWFQLPVLASGFGSPPDSGYENPVYFAQPGCGGQAYLGNVITPKALVLNAIPADGMALLIGSTLYWPDTTAQLQSVEICSQADGVQCDELTCGNLNLAPAKSFNLNLLGFKPPFKLQNIP